MNLKNSSNSSITIHYQELFVFLEESQLKQLWVQMFPFCLIFYSSRIGTHKKKTVEVHHWYLGSLWFFRVSGLDFFVYVEFCCLSNPIKSLFDQQLNGLMVSFCPYSQ